MTPIQIQMLSGPTTGRRASFTESPVTFGRTADNTLVLAESVVSRRHGELRYQDDRWLLVNQSVNGTWVNRKRVTTKPRPLKSGDRIGIEGLPLFSVTIGAAPPESAEQAEPAAPAQPAMSRKTKLWLSIGAYVLVILGFIIFGLTLQEGKKSQVQLAPELSDKQIADEIREPVQVAHADERLARKQLQEAQELVNRLESKPDALYRAHRAFKESLAYSGAVKFDEGIIQQQFMETEDKLVKETIRRYRDAYALLTSGQWPQAEAAFNGLKLFYSDADSPIFQNAEKQQAAARRQMPRRKL